MKITSVKIYKFVKEGSKVKAYASIVIDDCFVVNGLKVIEATKGLVVVMPSRKLANGEYKDIAFPINNETRQIIVDAVMAEYSKPVSAEPVQA